MYLHQTVSIHYTYKDQCFKGWLLPTFPTYINRPFNCKPLFFTFYYEQCEARSKVSAYTVTENEATFMFIYNNIFTTFVSHTECQRITYQMFVIFLPKLLLLPTS